MTPRRRRRLFVLSLVSVAAIAYGSQRWMMGVGGIVRPSNPAFVVAPYVQLGDAPTPAAPERLDVLWQGQDVDEPWMVEFQPSPTGVWADAGRPAPRRFSSPETGASRLYRVTISGLAPGELFRYRLRRRTQVEFASEARARKPKGQPHRFVAFGDGAANTYEQRAVAYQIAKAQPDFVLITGDLAYYKGLLSNYLEKFFPIYNSDVASPSTGAPLMRSVPFLVAPGNHDILEGNLDAYGDAFAYFYVWSLPLNGPLTQPGARNAPSLRGDEARRRAFLDLVGPAYPRAANYAFDYGDVHWTVLDANPYVDWTDPKLRDWLARDLEAAKDAPWRFVTFHQPPFHSTKAHTDEQWMRLVADLFEKHHVDLVFSGHIHNYQRTSPLHFVADSPADARPADGRVNGQWTLDTTFDGQTQTHPNGIIYIVTGAGGARLYGSWDGDASYRQPFTAKLVANTHSFTVVDVEQRKVTVRQVSGDGKELDKFVATK
jgi:3',5'-cyclic AMP phosphodiesterase CpdA